MTVGSAGGVRPWGVDPVLAALRLRFPGVEIWHGAFTGSLWALVYDGSGGAHLIEADTPAELGRRLCEAGARQHVEPTDVPSSPTSTRRFPVSPPVPPPPRDVSPQWASQTRVTSPRSPASTARPQTPAARLYAMDGQAAVKGEQPGRRARASQPSRPLRQGRRSAPPASEVRAARVVRGRHAVEPRRGWLRRLLDRLTWTEDW